MLGMQQSSQTAEHSLLLVSMVGLGVQEVPQILYSAFYVCRNGPSTEVV